MGNKLMDALEQLKAMDDEQQVIHLTLEERLLIGAVLYVAISSHDCDKPFGECVTLHRLLSSWHKVMPDPFKEG